MARRGQGLWNVVVVLDPQEGWIDENQNQTRLWEKPGRELDSALKEVCAFWKHQLCFAFAALRPAALAQRTHTHTDTHAAHCVWFALVLLLAFVNSTNWLCMSESCKFSDFWMKGYLYLSVTLSLSLPLSLCLSLSLCCPLTWFTICAVTSVCSCHACLGKSVTCDPSRPKVIHIQCRPLLLTVRRWRTKNVCMCVYAH